MRSKGAAAGPSKASGTVPATDDEIREKYLERAIRELNQISREIQECPHCPRGKLMPVLGSGHPQADVFMIKHAPSASEIEEGVAFYGRSGNALMKSFKRLGIDPLVVYGTLCVKCPIAEPDLAAGECVLRWKGRDYDMVQPELIDEPIAARASFGVFERTLMRGLGIEQCLRLRHRAQRSLHVG